MDGFYLAFVAVGVGLYWASCRRESEAISTALMTGWILLGGSLCSGVVLFAKLSGDPPAVLGPVFVFEALRHILLGGAAICIGVSFAAAKPRVPDRWEIMAKRRGLSDLDKAEEEDALEALKTEPRDIVRHER